MAEPSPPTPRSTSNWTNDWENPASTLLTATTAIPVAMTTGSPNRSTSRPAGNAPSTRISAKALITLAAAATLTPNCRANAGIAGATIPYPSATVNETEDSTAASRGSPRNGRNAPRTPGDVTVTPWSICAASRPPA
jgi:hypothetical protein